MSNNGPEKLEKIIIDGYDVSEYVADVRKTNPGFNVSKIDDDAFRETGVITVTSLLKRPDGTTIELRDELKTKLPESVLETPKLTTSDIAFRNITALDQNGKAIVYVMQRPDDQQPEKPFYQAASVFDANVTRTAISRQTADDNANIIQKIIDDPQAVAEDVSDKANLVKKMTNSQRSIFIREETKPTSQFISDKPQSKFAGDMSREGIKGNQDERKEFNNLRKKPEFKP